MLHIDEPGVLAVLHWDDLIPAMEAALVTFSCGHIIQPLRDMLTIEEGKRYLGIMHALGIGARMEIEKALGTPVDLDQLPTLQAPSASMRLNSFAPSSAPPNLTALGTRFSGFTTNETSTAWCGSNGRIQRQREPIRESGRECVRLFSVEQCGNIVHRRRCAAPFQHSGPDIARRSDRRMQ